jgi:hypothetical protein
MVGSLPFNDKKGCPEGYHKRASYTSKNGHRVHPRCIRSTTVYAESRKNYSRRILARQKSRLNSIGKSATRKAKCPPGQVERKGYVRKFAANIIKKGYTVKRHSGKDYRIYPERSTVFVKPSCVKDRGLPGKVGPGEGFGPIRKGELKKHGYIYKESAEKRRDAIKDAIKEFGALGVYHKLDAIAKLSRRTAPEAAEAFRKDREWLKAHYKLKAF